MTGAFTFNPSQHVVFENVPASKLTEHVARFTSERFLLVTDPWDLTETGALEIDRCAFDA